MITPEKKDFLLYKGCTWEYTYRVVNDAGQPVDLSGCTGELTAAIRQTELLQATYLVDGPAGLIRFTIAAAATNNDVWHEASFQARLLWADGKIDALGYGTFKLVK